jgi:hypothetical protein
MIKMLINRLFLDRDYRGVVQTLTERIEDESISEELLYKLLVASVALNDTEGINTALDAIKKSKGILNEEKLFRTAEGHIEPSEFEKIKDFNK